MTVVTVPTETLRFLGLQGLPNVALFGHPKQPVQQTTGFLPPHCSKLLGMLDQGLVAAVLAGQ